MGLSESIERITQAGFTMTVEDGRLMVEPFSALSDVQLTWLRAHKAEIIATLLDSDQGGHDLPPANDADQGRITVHVPRMTLASGSTVAVDLSVPASRLPDLEKALTVERREPGTLPADLAHAALAVCKAYGDGEAAQAAMLDDLRHSHQNSIRRSWSISGPNSGRFGVLTAPTLTSTPVLRNVGPGWRPIYRHRGIGIPMPTFVPGISKPVTRRIPRIINPRIVYNIPSLYPYRCHIMKSQTRPFNKDMLYLFHRFKEFLLWDSQFPILAVRLNCRPLAFILFAHTV